MRLRQAQRLFQDLSYPLTTDELVARVGDAEINLPKGTETVADVFSRLSPGTYSGPEEAYTLFLSGLSDKAIGRKWYSDRGPSHPRPRIDPLLTDDTRFEVDGPHCGICQYVELPGDWDDVAYCTYHDEIVEPAVDDVCEVFTMTGWSYTGLED